MVEETDGFVPNNPAFDNPNYDPDAEIEDKPEPMQPPPKKAARQIPAYLRLLMSMPGMNPNDLAVDVSTAWVLVESSGLITNIPVAFLAPEALETLENKGHSGHTTFQFTKKQGEDLIAYMACMLREIENDPEDETTWNADVPEQVQSTLIAQEMKISGMETLIKQMLADPLAPLESAFKVMDRVSEFSEKMMSKLPQGAGGSGLDVSKIIDTIATVTEVAKGVVGGVPSGDPNKPMDGDLPDDE